MGLLTTKKRNSLPSNDFALPAERAYPVDTHNRAANAKSRASQQYDAGHLSMGQKAKVDAKANKVLKGKK